ncbi:MAG: hypothetical protein AAGD40_06385 [Pseudomonadota bacterium]
MAVALAACEQGESIAPVGLAPTEAMSAETATTETTPAGVPRATLTTERLSGRWQVVDVAVRSATVQALTADDPAYLGKQMIVERDHIRWAGDANGEADGSASGAVLDDDCLRPGFAPQMGPAARAYLDRYDVELADLVANSDGAFEIGAAHALECDDGQWGPAAAGGAIFFPLTRDRFAMTWYDGAVLELRRAD